MSTLPPPGALHTDGPEEILSASNKTYFSILAQITSLCCCCCVTSVVSDSVRPHRRQPTRLPRPWDSPGKNTGVGCHFLLSRPLLFCVMGWELIKSSHSRTSTQESGPYPGCLLSFHRFALDILRAGALKRFSDTFGAARSAQPDFHTGHREQVRTASIRVNRSETESSRESKKGGRNSGLGVRERL